MTAPHDDASGLLAVLEVALREVVRQEVQTAMQLVAAGGGTTTSRWMTPPKAAREVGISEKAVRAMIKSGAIQPRLRNVDQNPLQPKFLVNVDEVTAAAQHVSRAVHSLPQPESLADRAARIRVKGEGR
jgi:hypothetical protein